MIEPRLLHHLGALLRWPFASPLASPLWFALRVYLGTVWLQFGLSKLRGGWLSTNPMRPLLRGIADGHLPTSWSGYRGVAELLLDARLDPVLSAVIPLLEVAVSVALFAGVLLVPAMVGACLLNLNLILSGVASWSYDGRIIALQLLVLMAWRVAGYLGLGPSLRGLGRSYAEALARLRPV